MPTFSSVIQKPSRRAAVPKAVPRRNGAKTGSIATSATSFPIPSSNLEIGGAVEELVQSRGPHTLQTIGPVTRRTPNSRQLISSDRQIHQDDLVDSRSQNTTNEPPAVLSSRPAHSPVQARAATSTRRGTQPEFHQTIPQPWKQAVPKPVAGRKRRAAELEGLGAESANLSTGSGTPEVVAAAVPNLSMHTRGQQNEISADLPIPSIEGGFTSAPKDRRSAPKPRVPPQPRTTASANLTTIAATSSAPPTAQETHRSANTRKSTSRPQSAAQIEADALLQTVTSQLSTVSRLAEGIDGSSRAAITSTSGSAPQGSSQTTASLAIALHRATQRQAQSKTADQLATEIIDEATGAPAAENQKRKRRKRTPEDAEEHIINPTETRMGDLTRDTGLGKKSGLEMQMQNVDWKAVKLQRKQLATEAGKKQEAERTDKRSGKSQTKKVVAEPAEVFVPQMTVVNGVIQVVNESREINIRQEAEAEAARQDVEVLTIDKITSRRNQNTIGKPKGLLGRHSQWSEEMDERFYKGIRMFGADMLMVASLFPQLERRHIKKKFVREERTNPGKLREALFNRLQVDAEAYQAETGLELGDPQKLEEELKAMEADLRKRFEEQMAEQHLGTHGAQVEDADIPIPSRERDDDHADANANANPTNLPQSGDPPDRASRFNAVADDIVGQALGLRPPAPAATTIARGKKGKKKAGAAATTSTTGAPGPAGRRKKDGSVAAPRKGSKAAKQAATLEQLGGTVEEIGTVDEIPR